jgi:hypothetical protein
MENLIMWNHNINQQQKNPANPFTMSYHIKEIKKSHVGDWIIMAWGLHVSQH